METHCKNCQQSNSANPIKWRYWPFILLLRFYRLFISPLMGPRCRFYPSCSNYAEEAIRERGLFKGLVLTMVRLSKCHPWHTGGYDPVPPNPKHLIK